jgi:hypothetical protein
MFHWSWRRYSSWFWSFKMYQGLLDGMNCGAACDHEEPVDSLVWWSVLCIVGLKNYLSPLCPYSSSFFFLLFRLGNFNWTVFKFTDSTSVCLDILFSLTSKFLIFSHFYFHLKKEAHRIFKLFLSLYEHSVLVHMLFSRLPLVFLYQLGLLYCPASGLASW